MSATGIGAPVRRKEDHRFITGQGRYTDDINRPGQAHAYFLRSPHAHATINAIDTKAAAKMPGVLGIFTGDDLTADKVGGLICGWMIHNKDGSPMRAGAHPALAQGKVRYVGDHVCVIVAETLAQARDASEAIVVDYGSSGHAVLEALWGRVAPRGRLPIEIPRSMDAVRRSREDVPSDTEDPLFPVHFGLDLSGDEGGRPDEE